MSLASPATGVMMPWRMLSSCVTVLPFGPEVQYSSEKPWDELDIRVYPGVNGEFMLYEDEGDNYNYEKGKFHIVLVVADSGVGNLPMKATKTMEYHGLATKDLFLR